MNPPADDLIILEPTEMLLPYAELGEGPHWDIPTQTLYWVDVPARLVHSMDATGAHRSWDAGMPIGAVVPRASGGLVFAGGSGGSSPLAGTAGGSGGSSPLAGTAGGSGGSSPLAGTAGGSGGSSPRAGTAGGNGFYALDTETGSVTELAATPDLPHTRMNDGKCDRAGRFYAGSMDADEKPGRGKFYRFDTDHSVTELYDGIGISNGLGWSPDDKRMYYIDSFAYRVDVVDYDVATGQMGERQTFARLGSGELVPDGLAVDSEGGVWVAVWGGSVIQRYDADARLTSVVKLPAAHVTSCAFGGPDLTELFITTAAGPGRSAGALFTCPAGVKGLPAYSYQG